jgi:ribosomal protein L11 methyltransferase
MMDHANPFAQPEALTECNWVMPEKESIMLENGLEDLCLASSRFIVDEDKGIWRVRLLMDAPQVAEIEARLAILRDVHSIDFARPETEAVASRDWVSEVQASFKPIHAGRFYVHGSHIDDVPQVGWIPIRIDAGAAFGTGEHETTTGCLLALDMLGRRRQFHRVLDMGCGSGILAIGAAKLWPCPVEAVDIDVMSVAVAAENMVFNGVQKQVRCMAGNGYAVVDGRFDLIIANILARPLMQMAGDLAAHLEPGGTAVLSGLLTRQERMVLWAHRQYGLVLRERIVRGGWSTLVLGK